MEEVLCPDFGPTHVLLHTWKGSIKVGREVSNAQAANFISKNRVMATTTFHSFSWIILQLKDSWKTSFTITANHRTRPHILLYSSIAQNGISMSVLMSSIPKNSELIFKNENKTSNILFQKSKTNCIYVCVYTVGYISKYKKCEAH